MAVLAFGSRCAARAHAAITLDKDYGCLETRRSSVALDLSVLPELARSFWPEMRGAVMVESTWEFINGIDMRRHRWAALLRRQTCKIKLKAGTLWFRPERSGHLPSETDVLDARRPVFLFANQTPTMFRALKSPPASE